ncbi:LamG domain-containing protein [Nocardioides dubius]
MGLPRFRQVYVVKTPQAATSKPMESLRFELDAGSDRVFTTPNGISIRDELGSEVFASGAAYMWDSTPQPQDQGRSLAESEADDGSPRSTPDGDSSTGTTVDGEATTSIAPEPGNEWAEMEVDATKTALVVRPDQEMMSDPATVFPVYVDPSAKIKRAERMMRSDGYEQWQFDGSEGMGRCPTSYSSECGTAYTKRLYFEFDRGELNSGDHLLKAEFAAFGTWSPSASCAKHSFDLRQTGAISPSSSWPGPSSVRTIGSKSMAFGHTNCPNKWAEFSNAALLAQAKRLATTDLPRLTLMLRATDESAQLAWKRFRQDAKLTVWFARKPGKPTSVGVQTGGGTYQCATWENATPVDEVAVNVRAYAQTLVQPKADSPRGALDIDFEVETKATSTSTDWTATATRRLPGASSSVGDGSAVVGSISVPAGKWRHRVRARTVSSYDETDAGAGSGALVGDWTSWCYFYVDLDAPGAPSVTSAMYPGVLGGAGDLPPPTLPESATGGPGRTGSFVVTRNPKDNDNNIAKYRVAVRSTDMALSAGPAHVAVNTSATKEYATFTFKPPNDGIYVVEVIAIDVLNRTSAATQYVFRVPDTSSNAGSWHVTDADAGEIANWAVPPSTSGPLVLSAAGVNRASGMGRRAIGLGEAGADDASLRFDGTGGLATSSAPVTSPEATFTATSWVYLSDLAADQVVFSEQGADGRGIEVALDAGNGRWVARWRYGSGGASSLEAMSPANTALAQAWVNVGVRFDGASLALLVNGRVADTVAVVPAAALPFQSTARLRVGGRAGGERPFKGFVDEIMVWNSALADEQLGPRVFMADGPDASSSRMALVRRWEATDAAGGLVDLSSYGGPTLASIGGAVVDLTEGVAVLDGINDVFSTANPAVDPTAGFTVAATFRMDWLNLAIGESMRVMGQRGSGGPGWALWYTRLADDDAGVPRGGMVIRTVVAAWNPGPGPT